MSMPATSFVLEVDHDGADGAKCVACSVIERKCVACYCCQECTSCIFYHAMKIMGSKLSCKSSPLKAKFLNLTLLSVTYVVT